MRSQKTLTASNSFVPEPVPIASGCLRASVPFSPFVASSLGRFVALSLLLLTSGCILPYEGGRTLKLEPQSRYIRYDLDFTDAVAAPSSDGGYDLVISDGFTSRPGKNGGPVFPAAGKRVSQVVHMHIAWRPMRASNSDYPAATNTTFHWYVFTGEPGVSQGVLAYQGIGFVKVQVDERETLFTVQDLTCKPAGGSGNVQDPLGPTRVSGRILAKNDAPAARRVLAQLDQQLAAINPPLPTPTTEPSGMPPARGPHGP